ncbi:MAG TPA: ATP-binding protein [Polyangiales bacterium]
MPLSYALLVLGALLQGCAVLYGILLINRRRSAAGAWLCLLCAMASMLVWRVVVLLKMEPPPFFNPLIAIWGSTCMLAAMFLFGREVARRERAEAERDALLESERAARSDAERAMRLKDEFLGTLSHELRTPLAAILGWCGVARNALERDESVARALEVIERNAKTQTRLVDDLLDVTRMQAGTLHLEPAAVDLGQPVKAALQSVRPQADAKHIQIELDCGEPLYVVGDAGRLQQVATNLLTNAVKFTPQGGCVQLRLQRAGEHAELVVSDTGEGMDPGFLPQLFTRFRQADSSVRRRHGGLGIGLSIVASLVRLHGGDVRAHSRGLGLGSTFTVSLPLASGSEAASEARARTSVPAGQSLAGIRILVVDDELDVRSALAELLERLGASVLVLDSGKTIESSLLHFEPHVLLVDIGMPGEDGYTLIRRVRKLPTSRGGHTPAISLTAHARNEDRAHALASGFQDHLPKPVDLPVLVGALRAVTPREVFAPGEAAQRAQATP